jgi:Trypsin-co-occurring domain 1
LFSKGRIMAGRVVPVRVGGVELLVETAPTAGTEQLSGKLDRAQATVAEAFDRAQSAIVAVAASTVDMISRLGKRSAQPDAMTVTFGLKFSAQGHVILAGASGEATLEVSLTYQRDPGRESGRPEAVGPTPDDDA